MIEKSKKRTDVQLSSKDRRLNLLADCLCVIALSFSFLYALETIFPFRTEGVVIFIAAVLLTVTAVLIDHVRAARIAILSLIGVTLAGALLMGDGPLSLDNIGDFWTWWTSSFREPLGLDIDRATALVRLLVGSAVVACCYLLLHRMSSFFLIFLVMFVSLLVMYPWHKGNFPLWLTVGALLMMLPKRYLRRAAAQGTVVGAQWKLQLYAAPLIAAVVLVSTLLQPIAMDISIPDLFKPLPSTSSPFDLPISKDDWAGAGEPFSLKTTGLGIDDSRLGGPISMSPDPAVTLAVYTEVNEDSVPLLMKGDVKEVYTGRGWEDNSELKETYSLNVYQNKLNRATGYNLYSEFIQSVSEYTFSSPLGSVISTRMVDRLIPRVSDSIQPPYPDYLPKLVLPSAETAVVRVYKPTTTLFTLGMVSDLKQTENMDQVLKGEMMPEELFLSSDSYFGRCCMDSTITAETSLEAKDEYLFSFSYVDRSGWNFQNQYTLAELLEYAPSLSREILLAYGVEGGQDGKVVRTYSGDPFSDLDGWALINELDLHRADMIEQEYAWVTARCLQLPAELPASVREKAQEIAGNIPSPYQQAKALERYLKSGYTYTLSPDTVPADEDFVAYFLKTGRGYCSYFASAMAVLARSLGIPARYVSGYALEYNRDNKCYIATDNDAHAWVELYFKGVGWVTFDPTPADYIETQPTDTVSSTTAPTTTISGDTQPFSTTSPVSTAPSVPAPSNDRKAISLGRILAAIGGCTALLALFLLLYIIAHAHEWRFVQRRRGRKNQYRFMYRSVIAQLKRLGLCAQAGETLTEFAARAEETLRLREVSVADVMQTQERMRYAGDDPTDEDVRSLCDTWQALHKIKRKTRKR